MKTSTRQNTAAALAGIAVIGGLAGCSSAGADAGSTATSTPAATQSSTGSTGSTDSSTSTAEGAASSTLADGTYTEDGSYNSPGGQESITVKATLAGGIVTDLTVTSNATNPNSKKYQGEFVDGINDLVVGKSIEDLNVTKVAGSSLTSGGFNDAIDKIIADAS